MGNSPESLTTSLARRSMSSTLSLNKTAGGTMMVTPASAPLSSLLCGKLVACSEIWKSTPPNSLPETSMRPLSLTPTPMSPPCKKLDPENPFCQIMGEYRLEFPRISSIEPYSHMNEHCSSQPPEYLRLPEGC